MQELDQIIQQNASNSEEMADTAEELARQAEQLQQAMAFFRIDQTAITTMEGIDLVLETGLSKAYQGVEAYGEGIKELEHEHHDLMNKDDGWSPGDVLDMPTDGNGRDK